MDPEENILNFFLPQLATSHVFEETHLKTISAKSFSVLITGFREKDV